MKYDTVLGKIETTTNANDCILINPNPRIIDQSQWISHITSSSYPYHVIDSNCDQYNYWIVKSSEFKLKPKNIKLISVIQNLMSGFLLDTQFSPYMPKLYSNIIENEDVVSYINGEKLNIAKITIMILTKTNPQHNITLSLTCSYITKTLDGHGVNIQSMWGWNSSLDYGTTYQFLSTYGGIGDGGFFRLSGEFAEFPSEKKTIIPDVDNIGLYECIGDIQDSFISIISKSISISLLLVPLISKFIINVIF